MIDETRALHPRPQLRRAQWTDLCGTWQFAFDDQERGLQDRWFERGEVFDREIQVPYPPESKLSGLHETGPHKVIWYRREFDAGLAETAERLLLHFGAVDYRASVWVNGRLAVEHQGGHTPFSADITHLLSGSGVQVIVVRAEDDPTDLQQPRGKQYWKNEPAYIWYHRTSGIWQPVWLEPVPRVAITELRWTADADLAGVHLLLRLSHPVPSGCRVRVRLVASDSTTVLADHLCAISHDEFRCGFQFNLDAARMERRKLAWAPEHPNLIDAEIELVDEGGAVIDRVESYFGLRRIEVQDGRFILNGVPTFLRLVLAQNYWPDSLLATPSADALRREVELVKELGFNGLRIHQKIEDPRFLYWCDRLGVLVWAEAANAYTYSDRAAEMLTREWLEAVRRDYSHPCIVTWVPLNESWGVPDLDRSRQQRDFVRALYYMTKAIDPTRPVIANDGWQHAVGDIFGVHDYAPTGDMLRDRYADREAVGRTFREVRPHHHPLTTEGRQLADEPIVISEFGGLSIHPEQDSEWFGYGQFESAEALLDRYEELVGALLESTALAGFCYTQLTDTEQETNGLLTSAREPKFDIERVRAINTRPSRSVPSEIMDAFIKQAVDQRREQRERG
jgi:beta-galactosidase/beta-glucuronidase